MEFLFAIIGLLLGIVGTFLWLNNSFKSKIDALESEKIELSVSNKNFENQLADAEQHFKDLEAKNDVLSQKHEEQLKSSIEWKSKLDATEEKLKTQATELEKLQEKFSKDFELIANKIFEEKSQKFKQQNLEGLTHLLDPLKERIQSFQQKVEESNEKNTDRASKLEKQLDMLRVLNQNITQETKSLTQALRGDSKVQGNWGEFHLESILEKAGLQKDVHYSKEQNHKTEDGKNQRLDYIINLPDDKHLIIDSKVSLTAYSNYYDAESEEDKALYLKKHIDSILTHISTLGAKDYQKLHGIHSPDYILMFIANEPALTIALKEDQLLFEKALAKNIVLVSTSTLLATLRTISYIWKQDDQNKNAAEIARQAGALYDKFVNFSDDLQKLGNQLGTVSKTYQDAMTKLSEGKGNLVRKAEQLKIMGADTSKQIDPKLIDKSED